MIQFNICCNCNLFAHNGFSLDAKSTDVERQQYTKIIDAYGLLGILRISSGLLNAFFFVFKYLSLMTLALFRLYSSYCFSFYFLDTLIAFRFMLFSEESVLIAITGVLSIGQLYGGEISKITGCEFVQLRSSGASDSVDPRLAEVCS